jgi:undecaprenyl diphosphate synthase
MDGNGRWARQQGRRRTTGHRQGARRVREITTECARIGIEQLTLYAFSVENWRRPKAEVRTLMGLLKQYLVDERPTLMDNNIRLRAIGRLDDLPRPVIRELDKSRDMSRKNDGMVLCLALSYSGRTEIVHAARSLARKAADGELDPESIDEAAFARHLYTAGMPEPDLLIRTAGEMRVSNFLLWQISYAELWVTERCWPDFRDEDLYQAISDYASRTRKFGGLTE